MAAAASAPTTSSNGLPDPTASIVKAPVVAAPSTPDASIATPSRWDQALSEAQQVLQGQVDPLNAEISANNANAGVEAQAAQADASAAAEMLKQIAPVISGIYTNAANETGTLAKGFSTDFQNTVDQAGSGINDVLSKIGAPAGQMVDPTKAADAANVLYGLGGFIPGQSFARQGAAAAGAAAMLPGIAIEQGLANAQKAYTDSRAANMKIEQNIAQLAGKLPGDTLSNYRALQTAALNDAKFAEQLRHNKVSEQQAADRLNVSQFTAKTNAYYKGVSASQAAQRISLDAAKFARTQFQQDRMYQVSLARLGISSRRLQLDIAKNEFSLQHGGLSEKQITAFQTKLDYLQSAAGAPGSPKFPTYEKFIGAALKKGIPLTLALQRANSIYPIQDQNLGALQQLPGIAKDWAGAVGASGLTPTGAHDVITGSVLGVNPKTGAAITWTAPKNLSPQGQKAVSGVLSLANEYLGTPYAWGGESPTGFDCSGLAQYIYAKEGVNIPRTSYDQWNAGISVPQDQLQPGDLVFFKGSDSRVANGQTLPGHVGIYVGDGQMIDAPNTGSVVRVESISGFGGYMGARRYVH